MKRGWLVVFAKAPAAGHVKTRFSPPFTPQQAADFYRCLLEDVLEASAAAARALGLEAVLAVADSGAVAPMAAAAPRGFRVISQDGGPLGERMARVAHLAVAAGAPCVVVRGSDSPCLEESTMGQAVAALAQADLVVCPDRDGGYSLVSLASRALSGRVLDRLFDHPMSTSTALSDTLANAERLALRCERLAVGFDLDRFEDLRILASVRHTKASNGCRRTLAFLDEHDLWPDGSAALRGPS